MKIILTLILLVASTVSFAQTEYTHYEQLRLKRKDKKIKTEIEIAPNDYSICTSKSYFDEEGYLRKKEFFTDTKISLELSSIEYDNTGNISGFEKHFEQNGNIWFSGEFNNMSPSWFYDIGFGESTLEEIRYVFDKKGRLSEKIFLYGEDNNNEEDGRFIYYYDSKNRIEKTIYKTSYSTPVTCDYFYNDNSLLILIKDITNKQETKFEYEFYN